MESQLTSNVLSLLRGVIEALTPHLVRRYLARRDERRSSEGSGPLNKALLNWMDLSAAARKKLARSSFIQVGGTREALFNLTESAQGNDSILAICGSKGDYSGAYYEKNFEKCRAVKRIFSYEAISDELATKRAPYALKGLEMHIPRIGKGPCDIEVILIPKGQHIKDIGARSFDPPSSFGLAILLDGNYKPKRAVIHWEVEAQALRHLISIEGIIIEEEQEELLEKLVALHESLSGSDAVLTFSKDPEPILSACRELRLIAEQIDSKSGVAAS